MSELSEVHSSHHDDLSVPKNLKTLVLKQQTQAVEDSIRAKGCRHLLVKPWPNGTAKYVSAVRCQLQRQGRDHWNQQVDPKETGDRRGEASFQPDGGGRRRRSQEIAGGSPYGGTISPEQSDRSSIPSGTNYGRSVPDQEAVGGELGTSRLMTTRSKKRSMGGIKETKACGKDGVSPSWRRNYTATRTQCIDFCEATTSKVHAVLKHAPSDLRGGTFLQHPRVLVATVDYEENPHLCLQILHAAI